MSHRTMHQLMLSICLSLTLCCVPCRAEVRVPGATAYLDPDTDGARVSAEQGVTRWNDPRVRVTWIGELKQVGTLLATVVLRVEEGQASRLRLTIAGESREVAVEGRGSDAVTADFGQFQINEPGYHGFKLESMNAAGEPASDIEVLVLDGAASGDAHFNLKPRRNAASVHLTLPSLPKPRR